MKLSGFQWLVQGPYEVIYDDSKNRISYFSSIYWSSDSINPLKCVSIAKFDVKILRPTNLAYLLIHLSL